MAHELEELKETLTKLGQADAAKKIKAPVIKGDSRCKPARRLFPQAVNYTEVCQGRLEAAEAECARLQDMLSEAKAR
eukprot:13252375-Alexandrium_andersonii.AAC.1